MTSDEQGMMISAHELLILNTKIEYLLVKFLTFKMQGIINELDNQRNNLVKRNEGIRALVSEKMCRIYNVDKRTTYGKNMEFELGLEIKILEEERGCIEQKLKIISSKKSLFEKDVSQLLQEKSRIEAILEYNKNNI